MTSYYYLSQLNIFIYFLISPFFWFFIFSDLFLRNYSIELNFIEFSKKNIEFTMSFSFKMLESNQMCLFAYSALILSAKGLSSRETISLANPYFSHIWSTN